MIGYIRLLLVTVLAVVTSVAAVLFIPPMFFFAIPFAQGFGLVILVTAAVIAVVYFIWPKKKMLPKGSFMQHRERI